MSEFKFTKGKWYYDETSKGIKNCNVKGLLATAWSTYNADIHENRLENESWLSMRERTKSIRYNCEIERIANAKLIADAGTTANECGLLPSELLSQRNEMLEMLEILTFTPAFEQVKKDYGTDEKHWTSRIEQLIKKATL